VKKLKKALSSQFFKNIGWLGISEAIVRVSRLGTTFTIARVFTPEDYGLMAIIYTTFEFATLIPLQGGIGSKIIQADEKIIDELCDTAYWLHWLTCSSAFILQCLGAFIYALISGEYRLILPLWVSGLTYLIFPLCMINHSLLRRDNRLAVPAAANAIQGIVANCTIVILALMGMGVWAIVWAILLSTPVWWILGWKNHDWRPPKHLTLKHWQEIFNFGKNIIGVELLTKLRMNLDYIIIGNVLGLKDLGLYYFAFNAGSGITLNIVNSITGAIYPDLCSVRKDFRVLRQKYYRSLKTICFIIVPLVILQSSLAPIYVPLIFGEKWRSAVPIVMMICSSVIPFAFSSASLLLLNAIDKTYLTLRIDLIYTIAFALSLLVSVHWGIYWVAACVALANWLVLPVTSIWITRYAFKKVSRL
jgi:O-antigen/teichoic acid export membrane protein